MVETRLVTMDDIDELSQTMRSEDAAEVYASGGYSPGEAAVRAVDASVYARALYIDGELTAIYGLSELEPEVGVVWMLSSVMIAKHRYTVLRTAGKILEDLHAMYPKLVNAVDIRHKLAVRFVSWLGATWKPPRPFGREGLPFMLFELRKRGEPCVSQ